MVAAAFLGVALCAAAVPVLTSHASADRLVSASAAGGVPEVAGSLASGDAALAAPDGSASSPSPGQVDATGSGPSSTSITFGGSTGNAAGSPTSAAASPSAPASGGWSASFAQPAQAAPAAAPVGVVVGRGTLGGVGTSATTVPTLFGMSGPSGAALTAAQTTLGATSRIHGHYETWANVADFPTSQATADRAQGAVPLYTWEPQDWNAATPNQPAYALSTILSGAHDAYITKWAKEIAAYGHPVLLRPMPEFNGNWEVWSPGVNGNTVAQFVPAWQHIVNLFRAAGATNALWVWSPINTYPGSTSLSSTYPGSSYVDWVAIDGYNWGPLHSSGWQTFSQVFAATITSLRALAPGKPLMLAEIGSNEAGGSKPAWVADALATAVKDGVRAVVWFEMTQETDWSLTSSAATSSAAKTALAAAAYRAGSPSAMSLATLEQWIRTGG